MPLVLELNAEVLLDMVVDQFVVSANAFFLIRQVDPFETARPEASLLSDEYFHVLLNGAANTVYAKRKHLDRRFSFLKLATNWVASLSRPWLIE